MVRPFFASLFFLTFAVQNVLVAATPITLSGEVRDFHTGEAIAGVSVVVDGDYLWSVSDKDGEFTIENIESDSGELRLSYLGYFTQVVPFDESTSHLSIRLKESSLAIDEVVVTAQSNKDEIATTYNIGRDALKHTQVTDVAEISALLPGGKTTNPDLSSAQSFSLRDGENSSGNVAFGTAVEVDGVRLSTNGSFDDLGGSDTRNISVDNIESIEVITGVPSVEYGDINSGIVKIKTRRGESPLNTTLTINPKTYMASASKGIALGEAGGVLNVSGEWAKASSSLVSPYTTYTRRGTSFIYSNRFFDNLRFESGVTLNFGGSNSEDDPDAYSGEYSTVRDNTVRFNSSTEWLVNRSWVTNLKLDFSINYQDKTSHNHAWYSSASRQPAVHSTEEGYFLADQLDYNFFSDYYDAKREIDLAGVLKYELNHNISSLKSRFKAGVQWKMTGNVGRGRYYSDSATSANGFRERDYRDYPFMHNLSLYAEERLTLPIGTTSFTLISGLRVESLFVDGSAYGSATSLSPRFNGSLRVDKNLTIRGGWGITEKLPSYYVLYPEQSYRDILSFSATNANNEAYYTYYTQPYALAENPNLKWQRNQNSEFGVDLKVAGAKIGLTAFHNKTVGAYQYSSTYSPFAYTTYTKPDGYDLPLNPEFKVDAQSGVVYVRDKDNLTAGWSSMSVSDEVTTFTKTSYADNGSDVTRRGAEMVVDLPEIKSINTRLRFDAAYTNLDYTDNALSYYYESGKFGDYVGIYATGNSSSSWVYNGYTSHTLNANITAVTQIPKARLIISCRVEMTLLNRWQYRSEYDGEEYAFNSDSSGNPTGGSIYDGDSYTSIYPVKYLDQNGVIHDFTQEQIDDPEYASLIRTSSNTYTFNKGGYNPYVYANLSVTKEIGDAVSLSFYANNFTFSRKAVESYSTGVSAVFTPNFYYGLTCRVKF